MQRRWMTRFLSSTVLSVVLCCATLHAETAKKKADKTPASAANTTGPMTMDMVLAGVSSVKRNGLPESRLLMLLQNRKINFLATPENLKLLDEAGATYAVLAKVRELGPTEADLAPKKTLCILLVKCEPAECEVRANDRPFEPTHAGVITYSFLGGGRFIVDAKKDGYEPKSDIYEIDPAKAVPGHPFEHSIKLVPNPATQALWGDELLKTLLAALPQSDSHSQTGELAISDPQETKWRLSGPVRRKGSADLELDNGQGQLNVACASLICDRSAKSPKSKKSPFPGTKLEKAQKEVAMLRNIEAFVAHEYSLLADGLTNGKVEALCKEDPSQLADSREVTLRVAQGAYNVTVDREGRPFSVIFQPATNPNLVSKVNYSDFRRLADGWYPFKTEIVLPGETHSMVWIPKDVVPK